MIYLACVVRGQLDPVFSFKDEHKREQDFKIKYNMYRYWNAVSVGYAKYLTIIPRARMGSESIAAEWAIELRGHEGERDNCFNKIQLVGQNYREWKILPS